MPRPGGLSHLGSDRPPHAARIVSDACPLSRASPAALQLGAGQFCCPLPLCATLCSHQPQAPARRPDRSIPIHVLQLRADEPSPLCFTSLIVILTMQCSTGPDACSWSNVEKSETAERTVDLRWFCEISSFSTIYHPRLSPSSALFSFRFFDNPTSLSPPPSLQVLISTGCTGEKGAFFFDSSGFLSCAKSCPGRGGGCERCSLAGKAFGDLWLSFRQTWLYVKPS